MLDLSYWPSILLKKRFRRCHGLSYWSEQFKENKLLNCFVWFVWWGNCFFIFKEQSQFFPFTSVQDIFILMGALTKQLSVSELWLCGVWQPWPCSGNLAAKGGYQAYIFTHLCSIGTFKQSLFPFLFFYTFEKIWYW